MNSGSDSLLVVGDCDDHSELIPPNLRVEQFSDIKADKILPNEIAHRIDIILNEIIKDFAREQFNELFLEVSKFKTTHCALKV